MNHVKSMLKIIYKNPIFSCPLFIARDVDLELLND